MSGRDPKAQLIRGAIWTVGTRWVIKALGFVNTIVMARLLMPEDYGIVAMGMLAINLIQTFLDFGATTALLRSADPTRDDIDSAWSLRLLQSALAGLLVLVAAPLTAMFYGEPRVSHVLYALAGCIMLAGLGSIGPTLAQRDFNFSLDFRILALAKLTSVGATIGAGMVLGDYRALIIGIAMNYVVPAVLGYLWHPYRPRWCTSKIAEIWDFSKWLLLAGIGRFVLLRGDQFVAGYVADTRNFGLYNVGADVGQLPVGEVGPAMLRALLPVLSAIQDDVKRTEYAVIKTLAGINSIIWPIGLGFAALAPQMVEVLLGDKWNQAAPYAAGFSVVAILTTSAAPARTLLTLRGYTRIQNHLVAIEFAAFCAMALMLVGRYQLIGLMIARIVAGAVAIVATLLVARHFCSLNLWSALRHIARPMVGSVGMAALVLWAIADVAYLPMQIFTGVSVGVATYTVWCLVTWHLGGRPEGLESTLVDKLISRRAARKGK